MPITQERQTLHDLYHALVCVFEAPNKAGFEHGLKILEQEYRKMRSQPDE